MKFFTFHNYFLIIKIETLLVILLLWQNSYSSQPLSNNCQKSCKMCMNVFYNLKKEKGFICNKNRFKIMNFSSQCYENTCQSMWKQFWKNDDENIKMYKENNLGICELCYRLDYCHYSQCENNLNFINNVIDANIAKSPNFHNIQQNRLLAMNIISEYKETLNNISKLFDHLSKLSTQVQHYDKLRKFSSEMRDLYLNLYKKLNLNPSKLDKIEDRRINSNKIFNIKHEIHILKEKFFNMKNTVVEIDPNIELHAQEYELISKNLNSLSNYESKLLLLEDQLLSYSDLIKRFIVEKLGNMKSIKKSIIDENIEEKNKVTKKIIQLKQQSRNITNNSKRISKQIKLEPSSVNFINFEKKGNRTKVSKNFTIKMINKTQKFNITEKLKNNKRKNNKTAKKNKTQKENTTELPKENDNPIENMNNIDDQLANLPVAETLSETFLDNLTSSNSNNTEQELSLYTLNSKLEGINEKIQIFSDSLKEMMKEIKSQKNDTKVDGLSVDKHLTDHNNKTMASVNLRNKKNRKDVEHTNEDIENNGKINNIHVPGNEETLVDKQNDSKSEILNNETLFTGNDTTIDNDTIVDMQNETMINNTEKNWDSPQKTRKKKNKNLRRMKHALEEVRQLNRKMRIYNKCLNCKNNKTLIPKIAEEDEFIKYEKQFITKPETHKAEEEKIIPVAKLSENNKEDKVKLPSQEDENKNIKKSEEEKPEIKEKIKSPRSVDINSFNHIEKNKLPQIETKEKESIQNDPVKESIQNDPLKKSIQNDPVTENLKNIYSDDHLFKMNNNKPVGKFDLEKFVGESLSHVQPNKKSYSNPPLIFNNKEMEEINRQINSINTIPNLNGPSKFPNLDKDDSLTSVFSILLEKS
jgi:hypothetical protein